MPWELRRCTSHATGPKQWPEQRLLNALGIETSATDAAAQLPAAEQRLLSALATETNVHGLRTVTNDGAVRLTPGPVARTPWGWPAPR